MTILVLRQCQVHDPQRGSFFVGVQADGRAKHYGKQVFKDAFDRRFVVIDAEQEEERDH